MIRLCADILETWRNDPHVDADVARIEADEVVQLLLLAMAADLPYTRIQLTMLIHPTVSELLPTLFDGLKPLV